jgi:hypothetical protein
MRLMGRARGWAVLIEARRWDRRRPAYLAALGFVADHSPLVTPFPTFTPLNA